MESALLRILLKTAVNAIKDITAPSIISLANFKLKQDW